MFYVGVGNDPKYPGIISGPFIDPPKLLPYHNLWKLVGDKWVLVARGLR